MFCIFILLDNDMIVNVIDFDEVECFYIDEVVVMLVVMIEDGNFIDCDIIGVNGVWYKFILVGDGEIFGIIVSLVGIYFVIFYIVLDEILIEDELVLVFYFNNQCVEGQVEVSIFYVVG